MALLSHKSATADGSGNINSIPTSVHADTHTLVVNPDTGATGSVAVLIRCNGGDFEPLKSGGSNVSVDLTNPISPVFIACITEAKLVGTSVVGSYTATLNSQGSAPDND